MHCIFHIALHQLPIIKVDIELPVPLAVYQFSFSFTFHCSVISYKESSSHRTDKTKTILFDLEVCLLPRLEMLGKFVLFGPSCNKINMHV